MYIVRKPDGELGEPEWIVLYCTELVGLGAFVLILASVLMMMFRECVCCIGTGQHLHTDIAFCQISSLISEVHKGCVTWSHGNGGTSHN